MAPFACWREKLASEVIGESIGAARLGGYASPLVVGHLRRATTPKAMAYRVREIAERILLPWTGCVERKPFLTHGSFLFSTTRGCLFRGRRLVD